MFYFPFISLVLSKGNFQQKKLAANSDYAGLFDVVLCSHCLHRMDCVSHR